MDLDRLQEGTEKTAQEQSADGAEEDCDPSPALALRKFMKTGQNDRVPPDTLSSLRQRTPAV